MYHAIAGTSRPCELGISAHIHKCFRTSSLTSSHRLSGVLAMSTIPKVFLDNPSNRFAKCSTPFPQHHVTTYATDGATSARHTLFAGKPTRSSPSNTRAASDHDRTSSTDAFGGATPPTSRGLDRVTIAGPLSGSTPLIEQIGLEVAVIDDLDAPADVRLGADAATAVRFTSGDHSSVLVPATDPVTQEMQRQIVNFLASDGQCLPLRGSCQ